MLHIITFLEIDHDFSDKCNLVPWAFVCPYGPAERENKTNEGSGNEIDINESFKNLKKPAHTLYSTGLKEERIFFKSFFFVQNSVQMTCRSL